MEGRVWKSEESIGPIVIGESVGQVRWNMMMITVNISNCLSVGKYVSQYDLL